MCFSYNFCMSDPVEVKIWNYALTDAEVLADYEENIPLNMILYINTKKSFYVTNERIELTA